MLSKMPRPSSTAATIDAKLSSNRTMADACFATSVPLTPMAIPMSTVCRAGASLTPSPVMATTWPRPFQARTTRSLCSAETRAYETRGERHDRHQPYPRFRSDEHECEQHEPEQNPN
jgi:hypothetical protein